MNFILLLLASSSSLLRASSISSFLASLLLASVDTYRFVHLQPQLCDSMNCQVENL